MGGLKHAGTTVALWVYLCAPWSSLAFLLNDSSVQSVGASNLFTPTATASCFRGIVVSIPLVYNVL